MFSFRFASVVCIILMLTSFCHAGLIGKSYSDGKVTEIMQVDGGGDFRCRISGKSMLAGARLRVHVRGINSLSDAVMAKTFVETAFKNAKKIELTNIRLRNYYRVIADVEIDGKGLADLLVKQGFAKAIKTPPITTDAKKRLAAKTYAAKSPRSGAAVSIGRKTLSARKTIATNSQITNSLKNSPVSLSGEGFSKDTTFEDAIDKIRNSVRPALPIVVLWPEIKRNCFVEPDTPIGFDWNGKISIKRGLDLLLMSVAQRDGEKLQYYVDGGIVTIASTKVKFNRNVMRVYNVAELTAASQMMNQRQGYGNNNRNRNNGNRDNSRSNRSRRSSRNNRRSYSGR
jgi:hypothetical protein